MKLVMLLLMANMIRLSASVCSHNEQRACDIEEIQVNDFSDKTESDSRYEFRYRTDFSDNKYVSADASDILPENSQQQKKVLRGKVADSKGESIPGATVIVKETTIGTITGDDGNFTLSVPLDVETLVVSCIGFKSQEIPVGNKTFFSVQLQEDVVGVEEVVIVGYGTQKKESVTGSLSSVDTKTLVQSPQANIGNALTGRLTGLLTLQGKGEPGSDQPILRIRGQGTFSGSADPLIMVDGIESANYNNIDPHEIESVTVLKDASATAVYGVRGANGVILITTKRGSKGSPKVSISSNLAVQSFTDLQKNLGSYEYAKAYNEALKYDSYVTGSPYVPKFTDEDIEHYRTGDDPIFHPDADWFSLIFKKYSPQTQHNVNISGGTDLIDYFISAGYFSQEGQYNNTDAGEGFDAQLMFRRYNFRSNFDFKITNRLSAKVDISSQIENTNIPYIDTWWMLRFVFQAPPYFSPGIVDGKVVNVHQVYGGNPFEQLLNYGYRKRVTNYLTNSVRLNYDLGFITKGLSTHGTLSYWNSTVSDKWYNKGTRTYQAFRMEDGTIIYVPLRPDSPFTFSESNSKNRKTYLEIGVDYGRTFGDHELTGLILYNQDKLYDPNLQYVIPNGHQGLVGRVTYNYKKRYMAEYNAGFNGTENFAPGKRFGYFPAYSLAWTVSEEPFFPKNNLLSYLKFRGSYGEVGNDKIGGNRFLFRPTSYYYGVDVSWDTSNYYFGVPGSTFQPYAISTEGIAGNPNLTWERAKKSNIGVDMTLLKDKLRITADYFDERRDNILTTPQTTPVIVGTTLPVQNWGKMKNSGYETEINFQSKVGSFQYWIKGIYNYAHNEILFMDEVKRNFSYQYRTGRPTGQMFGLIAEGFYNTWEEINDPNRPVSSYLNNKLQPGDFKYTDVNADGVIDSDDQVPIGYPAFPEITYGLSFGGEFRGFDFSILFQGADHLSKYYLSRYPPPFNLDLACPDYVQKYAWTPERYESGATIKWPRLSVSQIAHNYQASTFHIRNARYVRLKNAEIGYRFSKALLNRLHLSSLRIYANCNNLFTWDNLFPGDDPEQAVDNNPTYPITRTVNIGLNVEF
ncbi:MAG: TonB-dependent receptor [Prolixibacteraceae bacterium]|jgi:TonB-linked SusC/RagA family outer membrane protein|nr:TonB-dependent receptor [Prolixibacteraceae bacterium]